MSRLDIEIDDDAFGQAVLSLYFREIEKDQGKLFLRPFV